MYTKFRHFDVSGASWVICVAAWLAIAPASAGPNRRASTGPESADFPALAFDSRTPVRPSAVDVSIGPPSGITTDRLGNIFFSSPNLVLKLDTQGTLARVAGNVAAGYGGDGGPATQALLNFPASYPELQRDPVDFEELVAGLAVDSAGNLFIADAYNDQVRKVDATGIITTVGVEASSPGAKWPAGVAADPAGNLYISYQYGALLKRTPDGATTELAGGDCGNHAEAGLCVPEQIAVDAIGNVFVPDGYCRVRKIEPDGAIMTMAGDGNPSPYFTCGFSGDGGPATFAAMSHSFGVAVDTGGNVYIADTYNDRIRKVDASGTITTFAGGSRGYSGDGGQAAYAQLNLPHGVAVDTAGNVYIADTGNNRIRMVSPNGIISTVAGNGSSEPFHDADPGAVAAVVVEFYNPDLDNYFITADPGEQAYVESGAAGRWQRTGNEFNAGGLYPVCRFAGNGATNPANGRPYGPNSHFYTADPYECASLKATFTTSAPSWKFEGNDFSISTTRDDGRCATGLLPVYRAYNNGFARGIDANHRITSNVTAYLATVAAGWIGEGVVMCARQ